MYSNINQQFSSVRQLTVSLSERLYPEDTVVQPDMEVSPPKWHLAHTTWFFENFILKNYIKNYKPFHPSFDFLFNSYYQSQGTRVQRNMRGYHPRPLFSEIITYRKAIDDELTHLLASHGDNTELLKLIELGIHHEQQHQELLMTDLKNIWSFSPLFPTFQEVKEISSNPVPPAKWLPIEEGLYEIGYSGKNFHYDNEAPRHKIYLDAYELSSRPVTVGEYLEFVNAGGYKQWKYWLHEGWDWVQKQNVAAPLYWDKIDDTWYIYTLNGFRKINEGEILTHVSFYEADAFARWSGYRLPTEQEWEVALDILKPTDSEYNFLEQENYHPTSPTGSDTAFLGQVWEWTNSSYLAYPGYKPWEGDVGEYNGKFMINQMVLRGGSCVTPQSHIRSSYRNFFHPNARWQFTGIRLAKNSIKL